MSTEPTTEPGDFATYAAFWPYYLSQHRQRSTQFVHVIGTFLALMAILEAVLTLNPLWLLAAPVIGYGFAWVAHALIEKNHPATFTYPLWSLRGDLHMLGLWLTGRLDNEMKRRGLV